jgi:hypothetical protein
MIGEFLTAILCFENKESNLCECESHILLKYNVISTVMFLTQGGKLLMVNSVLSQNPLFKNACL